MSKKLVNDWLGDIKKNEHEGGSKIHLASQLEKGEKIYVKIVQKISKASK
jgi:hypothetical protein